MIQVFDARQDREAILKRFSSWGAQPDQRVLDRVREIIKGVQEGGDEALLAYSRQFDWPNMTARELVVPETEISAAYSEVEPNVLNALRAAAKNIRAYHEQQKREGFMMGDRGKRTGQMIRPLNRVGVYVPGGRAAYPSSVLMNIIPAKVAGVAEIIMVTPADKNGRIEPLTLVAANEAGADMVLRIGGAQAVAALAYGTKTVPKVDKITGPGNSYVAAAKREVFGVVGIDMIAGPSEVLILADASANAALVAADMLSQAEHDPEAAAFLVTDSLKLAEMVQDQLLRQLDRLPRREIADRAISGQGGIVITENLADSIEFANAIAPEHLELMVERPAAHLEKIHNAGAVILGAYSPEPLGDYLAGPNHVLPTGGTARFSSPLGVDDFIKRTSIIFYSKEGLEAAAADVTALAYQEGLSAHARAVEIRFEK